MTALSEHPRVWTGVAFVLITASFIMRGGFDSQITEVSDKPSPRTTFSGRSRAQIREWYLVHANLTQEAQAAGPTVKVLFLGDSITESWRGTSYGHLKERTAGVPAVFDREFRPLGALALAISGDQTQHLLWRLKHGELPLSLQPKVIVLMIGTNNLGAGFKPSEVARGSPRWSTTCCGTAPPPTSCS